MCVQEVGLLVRCFEFIIDNSGKTSVSKEVCNIKKMVIKCYNDGKREGKRR